MKKILTIVICLLMAGCGEVRELEMERTTKVIRSVCDDSTMDKRAEFTLSCISSANPKSDEEPEDWIILCQGMAIKNYCPEKRVSVKEVRDCKKCTYFHEVSVTVIDQTENKS